MRRTFIALALAACSASSAFAEFRPHDPVGLHDLGKDISWSSAELEQEIFPVEQLPWMLDYDAMYVEAGAHPESSFWARLEFAGMKGKAAEMAPPSRNAQSVADAIIAHSGLSDSIDKEKLIAFIKRGGQKKATMEVDSSASKSQEPDSIDGETIVEMAMKYLGVPYVWGGESARTGFDCSGLVKYVFKKAAGTDLPRTAIAMAQEGVKVSKAELQPGDLVFFNTLRRAYSHVGIHIGDGKFIHAPRRGKTVEIAKLDNSYWNKRFNGAIRVMN